MSKSVNVAMVGLGFGAEFIPIYQAHPNTNVAAICRRNETELNKNDYCDAGPGRLDIIALPDQK